MSAQGSLFRPFPTEPPKPALLELRPYQTDAVAAVHRELLESRSTLLVMATGTGKTRTFAQVISDTVGRCLVLAHRDELIQQAVGRIERETGRRVGIEKADQYASSRDEVVVGSVQTMYREDRLKRFGPDAFKLVVADEAHHYVAPSFRRCLDFFTTAKILGVTATPDRADRLALGQVFDSVAYLYDIEDAIKDGWLCPIRATSVHVESLSLAEIKTVAGDLNQAELDAVMSTEKVLHGVVRPSIDLAEDRRALIFTTSVENAHRMAEVFCRYKPDSAKAVDGGMDLDDRRRILADHKAGRFQFLVNVGIATEGYDDPEISCVVVARPTKSRSLYTQMVGRGTRITPGKTDLLVVDITGNPGKHALVSPADVLAGRYADDVTELAKEIIRTNPGVSLTDALAQAEAKVARQKEAAEAAERRRQARARVQYRTQAINPFVVLDVADPGEKYGGQFGSKPATDKQLALLAKMKVPLPEGWSSTQASKLIGTLFKRRELGLCTFGQAKTLKRFGYDTTRISFDQARTIMDALAHNNWRPLAANQNAELLARGDAGADG